MKVEGYGDMLSKFYGKPLIAYVEFGSYQGDWVGVLDAGEYIELYKGCYGSCSGCDFIEGEQNYETDEIAEDKVKEYFTNNNEIEKPFLIVKKEDMKRFSESEFESLFPANIRDDVYEYNSKEMFDSIKKGLTNG